MIKAIVFDLGKVILDFDNRKIARRLSQASPFTEETVYSASFKSRAVRDFDLGHVSPEEFYSAVRKELSLDMSFEEFSNAWCDIFVPVPGAEDLIRSLKASYRLMLLSNTNKLHFDHIQDRFPVVSLFDEHLLSFRLGCMKPDPNIYRTVVERSGCNPGEIFYTDDTPEYVEPALLNGFEAVVFSSVSSLVPEMNKRGIPARLSSHNAFRSPRKIV